ncbi:MAG: MBL fold metallo-hydrolase [Patescibacteria group bacterium]|nr:MBL fold metallo-hydrolase [Patescibacteria group bacterium]
MEKILKLFFLLTIGIQIWLAYFIWSEAYYNYYFKIYFLNVGQGDSILIRTKTGINVLIDGGPGNQVVNKLGKYLPFYDNSIDLMILTHPHADHLTGLIGVLRRNQVKKILTTDVNYHSGLYEQWQHEIKRLKTSTIVLDSPRQIDLNGGAVLSVIRPTNSLAGLKINNLNNTSIVSELAYQGVSFLLMGDYEQEETLAQIYSHQQIDLLKVGHHGADDANSWNFLNELKPTIAIISVGLKNRYHHPGQKTLTNLTKVGAKILRTDQLGDICFGVINGSLRPCR